jgi:hypothetical protein
VESVPDSKLEALFVFFAGVLAMLLPFIVFAGGIVLFLMWLSGLTGGSSGGD